MKVEIKTADGACPAWVFGDAKDPAVLFFMDGVGIRPAMFQMGERLAKAGYRVLLPDLFWRVGPYEPMNAKTVFTDPAERATLMSKFMPAANPVKIMSDVPAFLDFLGAPKVRTTGYCMGGRLSFIAAGTYPDRVAAAAAFHPGGLVTDAPESPHLLAPRIKARVYIGRAIEDANFTDAQLAKLEQALTAARVDHRIETYPARHGWVPTDTPAHDPVQAERHWQTLLELFKSASS